jgi:hypothetical protein
MSTITRLSGIWRGRLIDIQGLEGDVELNLKSGDNGQLHGTFSVEIGGHHATLRQHGSVQGKSTERGLRLALVGDERPVKIGLTGNILQLRDGGMGLSATYEVSAKGFSPLQGGVVCASKGQKVEVELVSKREVSYV